MMAEGQGRVVVDLLHPLHWHTRLLVAQKMRLSRKRDRGALWGPSRCAVWCSRPHKLGRVDLVNLALHSCTSQRLGPKCCAPQRLRNLRDPCTNQSLSKALGAERRPKSERVRPRCALMEWSMSCGRIAAHFGPARITRGHADKTKEGDGQKDRAASSNSTRAVSAGLENRHV
jgi:hypothetical protein